MKVFIHDYSLALFAMICIIFMIFTLSPISVSTKKAMFDVVTAFTDHTSGDNENSLMSSASSVMDEAVDTLKPKVYQNFYVGINSETKEMIITGKKTNPDYVACDTYPYGEDTAVSDMAQGYLNSWRKIPTTCRIVDIIQPGNGVAMFERCSNLQTITGFENVDLSRAVEVERMFYGCSSLQSIDLTNLRLPTTITRTNSMFQNCSSIQSIKLGGSFTTGHVTSFTYMFSGCSSLTDLNIEALDTSSATTFEAMFQSCSHMTSLDLSHMDASHVTNMSSMFNGCSRLETINFTNYDTSSCINMNNMFQECKALNHLDLSSFDTSHVTGMGWMFYWCSALTDVNYGEHFTNDANPGTNNMFGRCSAPTPDWF